MKNIVTENNQIVYNDGVTKIFLYAKGHKEGLEEGIHGAIQAAKLLNADEEKTKTAIMAQFSLKESEAEEYITKYWDKPLKKTDNDELLD